MTCMGNVMNDDYHSVFKEYVILDGPFTLLFSIGLISELALYTCMASAFLFIGALSKH